MRRALAFLMILIVWIALSGAKPLRAEEAIIGRVLKVNRDEREVVVAPAGDETAASREIRVSYPPDGAPSRLKAGDLVRIWGDFADRDHSRFEATHLGYGSGGTDPTGVRSRIGRGRGMGGGRGRGRK